MVSGKHIIALAALALPLLLWALYHPETPASPDIDGVTGPSVIQTPESRGSETSQVVPPRAPSVEEVAQVVRARNDDGVQRLAAFRREGWEEVKVDDPPDEEVMRLSLNLLGRREAELQAQIQSNSFTQDQFERLSEIALTTTDDKTRYVALEALGRSGEKSAQLQLTQIYEQTADEETRSQIIGYLTPATPDDEIAIFLTEQLADPNISERLKKQAAFPLAMTALLETADPEAAKERMSMEIPEEWSDSFSNIVNLIATGGL